MNMKQPLQTKTKTARQTTGIATGIQTTRKSFYLTLVSILALGSLFLHQLAGSGQEGLFGFKYMSSFLNALGIGLTVFFLGLLLNHASTQIKSEYRDFYNQLSKAVIALGVFYLLYVFIPMNDYPKLMYFFVFFTVADYSSFVFAKLNKMILRQEQKLKSAIRMLFDFILFKAPEYIDQQRINEYEVECLDLSERIYDETK